MKLIENIFNNLNFDNTKNDIKWKDYKGGDDVYKIEEFWNESGFDEYTYEALIFLSKKVNINEMTILDIGSGKGQAIFNMALNFEFHKIKGIELIEDYVRHFNSNLSKLQSKKEIFVTSLDNIINININALDYKYENEDIYIFFNSVGEKNMKRIIDRIINTKKSIYIIYYNALHFNLFQNICNMTVIYKKICKEFNNPKLIVYKYN